MKELELKYGCNPNQKPSRIYMADGSELPIEVLNGRPGYINFLDAFNGWQLVRELKKATGLPAATSFKHVSPAGASVGRPMSDTLKKIYWVDDMGDLSPLACAYARARGADRILAVITGWCLLGGGSRIVKVTSTLVPAMGVAYILISVIVMIINRAYLPVVFSKIISEAFDFKAIFGAFAGSAMMQGIRRGLYSNEAGIGSAPNASASAQVSHPIKQGLVQMLSVFIDTLLLCTATAMMCLSSGIAPAQELQGAPWVQAALHESLGNFGPLFITVAMVLFAFTTLLGNCFYCDNLLNYIHKGQPSKTFMKGFRIVSALVVFIGAGMEVSMLWNISDVLMGVMALINIPVILILSNTALKALEDYEKQKKNGENPVFKTGNIGLEYETDYWS